MQKSLPTARVLRWGFPALVVGGTLAVACGTWPRANADGGQPAGDRPSARATDPKVKELLEERLATLRDIYDQLIRSYGQGASTSQGVHQAHLDVLNAELDFCESNKDRIAVLAKIVTAAKEYEVLVSNRVKANAASPIAQARAKVARLDAEINLQRAKADASAPAK